MTKYVVSSPLPLTGTSPRFSTTNPLALSMSAVASVTCGGRGRREESSNSNTGGTEADTLINNLAFSGGNIF